jgi:outer membrane protein assembly factor BamB
VVVTDRPHTSDDASGGPARVAAPRARRTTIAMTLVLVGVVATGIAVLQADLDSSGGAPDRSAVGAQDSRGRRSTGDARSGRSGRRGDGTTSTTRAPRTDVLVDPASFGQPWGSVPGLLTFRGNPTRSWYGTGPAPRRPGVRWSFPDQAMCSESSEFGETRTWCGTGWTGQPAVFERGGRTWLVFGGYDRAVHFVDARTGERILDDFPTGDIIKGSVTVDPDGYPIVYTGSRDNYLRAVAIDRAQPVELWKLSATESGPTLWNNDWDGSPLVVNGHLVEGGENSRFHVVALNRDYDADGMVTIAPQLTFSAPGWDDQLLADLASNEVSIENSVAISGDTAYFSNSGGLVQGWDLSSLRTGTGSPHRTFRWWSGDDMDASIVVDDEGFLYAGAEYERGTARSREVGQLLKLDPRRDDPVVWSVPDASTDKSGTWSTPAIVDDTVIWPTRPGRILGLDRATGATRWEVRLPAPIMGSPVVVDGVWIQGDCNGVLHGFDVRDPSRTPTELWAVSLGGCIESTPAVWDGWIYVGTRGGRLHALADPGR